MLPYEITSPAEEDLKEIARYTLTQWGKKKSLHYAGLLKIVFGILPQERHIPAPFQNAIRRSGKENANTTIFSISTLKKSHPTLLLSA